MKIKTKLIASIMSICLVCAVFAIGVFALKIANLKIGGDVSFSATGVEADIKNVTLTGATNNDQVLATGSINTSMTQADIDTKFQNWQSLKLDFDADATDIELKFDIANTSTNADNYIEIDYSYSFSNTNPNVDVFPGDENDQKVWENNNYILAPKGSAANATYETFTLKFKVIDKELNVPQDTKVTINIALKHHTAQSATATNNVVTIDNIQYTLNSPSAGFATVTGCTTETSALIHPVVKTNAEGAIPCVVTKIGDSAFEACEFTSITIPSSVTNIGDYAFCSCSSLTTITIPSSVTSIGEGAFAACELTSVNIPQGVTIISDYLFYCCMSLSSIIMPETVTIIGVQAFSDCTEIISLTIPRNVTQIGDSAFCCCYKLVEINNLSSVDITSTSYGLEDADINIITPTNGKTSQLFYVDDFVFFNYNGLKELVAYKGSETELVIPTMDGECAIRQKAFEGYKGLTKIVLPENVIALGDGAFSSCTNLKSVYFDGTIEQWLAITFENNHANPLFNKADLYINNEKVVNLVVSNLIASIGNYTFSGCTSLSSISIPDKVTSIGDSTFYNCTNLKSVIFEQGSKLQTIGDSAFRGCTSLNSINIPDMVTSIGAFSFIDCANLSSINIPEKVTYIGRFAFQNCISLSSVSFGTRTGWWYSNVSGATSGPKITESEFTIDASAANALLLTKTYLGYTWYRAV